MVPVARVRTVRVSAAMLIGLICGAVAGPTYELFVSGYLGSGIIWFAAFFGATQGFVSSLLSAMVVNLYLKYRGDSFSVALTVLLLVVLSVSIVQIIDSLFGGSSPRLRLSLIVVSMFVAVPAAFIVAIRSRSHIEAQ